MLRQKCLCLVIRCNTSGYLPKHWWTQCVCAGTSIEKLRSQALASAAAEGVGRVSANDIMSAMLWLIRYRLQSPFYSVAYQVCALNSFYHLQDDMTMRPLRPASHPSCGAWCLILLYDKVECAECVGHTISLLALLREMFVLHTARLAQHTLILKAVI